LRTIRATPEIAHIPVILISARADNNDIVRGLEEGANDYLIKPSSASVVQARIHTQVMLKQLMDEHRRVIEELLETQKMRDQLFRIASHDLKAPLTNIRLTEFLLRDIVGNNNEGQEILDSLVNNLDNMEGVIEKFLDVAAFQSGKIELDIQCVPIESAVLDVMMEYTVAAANKNISIEAAEFPGMVMADPKRLRQILSNLVSNAVKYSPKGSTVSIWSELLGEYVRINVADHGPGIPADERHLLFQEFGKLSTRPTGQESSTGLGLWIAKHLTTLQHGEIGVDSPADGGSVFWVMLPECVTQT
jgi:signal transduction histidine kinase